MYLNSSIDKDNNSISYKTFKKALDVAKTNKHKAKYADGVFTSEGKYEAVDGEVDYVFLMKEDVNIFRFK